MDISEKIIPVFRLDVFLDFFSLTQFKTVLVTNVVFNDTNVQMINEEFIQEQ